MEVSVFVSVLVSVFVSVLVVPVFVWVVVVVGVSEILALNEALSWRVDGEAPSQQDVGQLLMGWAGVIFLDNPICNPTLFNPT